MATNMNFTDFVTPVPADWLNFVNGIVNTPGLTSYTAPFSGAISRTITSTLSDLVSVLNFGADPTGVLDSTLAMQAAHNTGRLVYYPGGTYKFNKISIAGGGIVGDGIGQTVLLSTNLNGGEHLVTFTGANNGNAVFQDFQIQGSLSKTSGAALRFVTTSGTLTYPYIRNVQSLNIPTGVYFSTAQQFIIDSCVFVNYSQQGVYIENTGVSDAGDSCISNCFFNTSVPTGATYAVWHRSGGGLKIVNCKMLGGDSGYVMGWTGDSGAADLSIVGCSIEDTTNAGIFLGRDSGSGMIGSVMIVGNEIGCKNGITTDTSGFIILLNITGNVINIAGTTTAFFGIALNNISHFIIGPNVINGSQGGGTPIGIGIAANCTNGKISPQTYVGLLDANCLNSSSTSVFIEGSRQIGAVNVTASTTYGTLFQGSAVVTFPVAYKQTPTVVCYPTATSGGQVNVFATNITKTGFTMVGLSGTSGGVLGNNTWIAEGII